MPDEDALSTADDALLGPSMRDHVARLLAREGRGLRTMETAQVLRQPGRRTVVRWRISTDDGSRMTMVGVARRGRLPDGLDVVTVAPDVHVGLFRPPDDPSLPGLVHVATTSHASDVLGQEVVRVQRRRYRPLTRAVVEIGLEDGSTLWAKVVPPRRATALADVHDRCSKAIDGPAVVLRDVDLGLVVLTHVTGRDLRSRLRSRDAALPDPHEVVELVRRLATVTSPRTVRRTPPLPSVGQTVDRLHQAVPDQHDRIAVIARRIARTTTPEPRPTGPTIHGDLHSAQIMVHHGRVHGLIDLDDAGAGDIEDDLARFLGHLVCTTDRQDAAWARAWTRACHRTIADAVPAADLQPRVAATLLSLAMGPYRVHQPGWQDRTGRRLDLAHHWSSPDIVRSPWPA